MAEEPECRVDQDCPSKLACISQSCQNPCNVNNPCQFDQRCVVIDSLPSRSVACVCPDGTVLSNSGQCTQGNFHGSFYPIDQVQLVKCKIHEWFSFLFTVSAVPQCRSNSDCRTSEVCHTGSCINACIIFKCGANAVCTTTVHDIACTCRPGFTGNGRDGCIQREYHNWRRSIVISACSFICQWLHFALFLFSCTHCGWTHNTRLLNQFGLPWLHCMQKHSMHQPLCRGCPLCPNCKL